MIKKIILLLGTIGVVLITIAFFQLNPKYGFIGKDRFDFTVSEELDLSKLKVKYGFLQLTGNLIVYYFVLIQNYCLMESHHFQEILIMEKMIFY